MTQVMTLWAICYVWAIKYARYQRLKCRTPFLQGLLSGARPWNSCHLYSIICRNHPVGSCWHINSGRAKTTARWWEPKEIPQDCVCLRCSNNTSRKNHTNNSNNNDIRPSWTNATTKILEDCCQDSCKENSAACRSNIESGTAKSVATAVNQSAGFDSEQVWEQLEAWAGGCPYRKWKLISVDPLILLDLTWSWLILVDLD